MSLVNTGRPMLIKLVSCHFKGQPVGKYQAQLYGFFFCESGPAGM